MRPDDRPTDRALEEIRRALTDPAHSASRMRYISEILDLIIGVADWLRANSWLEHDEVNNIQLGREDRQGRPEFRAVWIVICMSAELAEGAVDMAKKKRYCSASVLICQLIECEYLLTLFRDDLNHARRWEDSAPDEVRYSFTTGKMLRITGFSDREYWNHRASAGHPAWRGARLLERFDPTHQSWPYFAAELLIDLGLHLHRNWNAIDAVLAKHHARYAQLRAEDRHRAEQAWSRWREIDPMVEALLEV